MSANVPCTSVFGGPCDRPAVAAVHVLTDHSVLIRADHLDPAVEMHADDWRCADCLHHDIDDALNLHCVEGPR